MADQSHKPIRERLAVGWTGGNISYVYSASITQAEPEGSAIDVDESGPIKDTEHELARRCIDHTRTLSYSKGGLTCPSIDDARISNSISKLTCLYIDYTHAIELVFSHDDIMPHASCLMPHASSH